MRDDLLADRSSDKPGGGVFRRACSASSCHGETPKAGLFIAPPSNVPLTEEHVDQLLAAVLRKALSIPSMDIVKPHDPEGSFLMRKIDGCFDDIAGECTPIEPNAKHACGDRMPQGLQPLCADERDMIRRWIAQGAVP